MESTILVNKDHPLDIDYTPESLVEIYEPTGVKLDKSYVNKLDKVAYEHFKLLQAAALKEGYEIFIDSSFRSSEYQLAVFDRVCEEKGVEHAFKMCALPGSSEHQTGLAIDVISRRNGIMIEESSDDDPEIIWLMQHAHEYGYILRYPKGKEDITGFEYERWHYRFVGIEAAYEMFEYGQTLEEYHQRKR